MSDEEPFEREGGGSSERSDTSFDDLLDRLAGDEEPQPTGDGRKATDLAPETIPIIQHPDSTGAEPGSGSGSGTFDDLLARIRQPEPGKDDGGRVGLDDLRGWATAEGGTSVLVVGSLGSEADNAVCLSGFAHSPLSDQRVLLVTLGRQGMQRFRAFQSTYGDEAEGQIIHLARTDEDVPGQGDSTRVERIQNPGDLPQVGITISRLVDDWEDADGDLSVCLHSLTMLLEHADEQRVFRFLHLLLDRLDVADARVHVHLDAEAHDEEVVHLFGNLFDATVHMTDSGLEQSA